MSVPTGLARGLQRALGLESVRLEQPYRPPGVALLLNPRRLEILLTAAAYPGIHLRAASRLLVSPLPSLRFHVHRLQARGLLRTRLARGRLLLFVPGMYPPDAEVFLGTWQDPTDRRVLQLIRDEPGIQRPSLSRQLVPDGDVLSRSLDRLRAAGAIRTRRSGGGIAFEVTPRWKRFEGLCRRGVPDRLQRFLALLASEGLRPVVEELGPDWARLSVDGPRSRIRLSLPLDPLGEDTPA